MNGDWQANKSVTECNCYMLEHEIATDVMFIVSQVDQDMSTSSDSACKKRRVSSTGGNTVTSSATPVRIKAHKYMLVSRSPVFYAMFLGPLAEQGEIRVTDCHPDAFRQMLNFVYTDSAELTIKNMIDVLYIARKYMLPSLINCCEKYFESKLRAKNAVALLEQCIQNNEEVLMEKCHHMIMFQTEAVFAAESWSQINREMLKRILRLPMFSVPEIDVFKFVVMWGEHEAHKRGIENTTDNIRESISDLLPLIRFYTMTMAQFAEDVVPTKMIDPDRTISIFQYMCSSTVGENPEPHRHAKLSESPTTTVWRSNPTPIHIQSVDLKFEIDIQLPIIIHSFELSELIVHKTDNKYVAIRQLGINDMIINSEIDSSTSITKAHTHKIKSTSINIEDVVNLGKGVQNFQIKLEVVDKSGNVVGGDWVMGKNCHVSESVSGCKDCELFSFRVKELKFDGVEREEAQWLSPVIGITYKFPSNLLTPKERLM